MTHYGQRIVMQFVYAVLHILVMKLTVLSQDRLHYPQPVILPDPVVVNNSLKFKSE